jgi:hypothetical protein
MKQRHYNFQNLSRVDKIKVLVTITFMGILLIILGFLGGMLLRKQSFEFSLPSLPVQAMSTSFIPVTAPTAFEQNVDCTLSDLVLGTTTFQIQDLTRGADGSLAVPADTSGIAYRIAGTGSNTVFILSPTPQNISVMSTISTGSPATLLGPGCTPVTYSLTAPQSGSLDGSVFAGQSDEQITVFFPTASSGAGFTFRGRRVTEPVVALNPPTPTLENILVLPTTAGNTALPVVENTAVPSVVPAGQSISSPTAENIIPTSEATVPPPDYAEVLAEIGLVDTSLSLFRTSLKIEVSIYNFGEIPIILSESNVTLKQPDGTLLALKSSNPDFPAQIQPGETKTIELNFQKPSSPTATLKILTVEYDIEGY